MIYVVLITFQVSEKHKLDDSSCDRYPVKVCGLFTFTVCPKCVIAFCYSAKSLFLMTGSAPA
jgi:hypothetical protein